MLSNLTPPTRPDPFARRMVIIALAIAALMLLWRTLPLIESLFVPEKGEIRTVTARGDLALDERTTIE
ncbi:MAG TPA: 2-alkenal reductase, partial [Nitrosomonas sp.]|nr:2-alkenal reductase [Nitrosomonas sp.]